MEKTVLIILTSQFPYGKGESFLESELLYYSQASFDKILCIPISLRANGTKREVPNEVKVVKLGKKTEKRGAAFYPVLQECLQLVVQGRFNSFKASTLLDWYQRASDYIVEIESILQKEGIDSSYRVIIYSYWLDIGALVAALFKKKYPETKSVSRCHGIDLYEERHAEDYLPFRRYLLKNLDSVYPISQAGKKYLEQRYSVQKAIIKVRRLGTLTNDKGLISKTTGNREVLKIVSCSNLIPLKRVNRIVDTLSRITDMKIEWTHFGGGVMLPQIQKMCEEHLGNNVTHCLKGYVTNQEILKEYETKDFHVFLHLSQTEGIPVSFMEASSYGIPIVATNVGGVSEIVCEGRNGYLLDTNLDIDYISKVLHQIQEMDEGEYLQLRKMQDESGKDDITHKKIIQNLF